AKRLTSYHPRLIFFSPLRIKERVRTVSVAVGPAVYGYALDVAGRIKACRSQHGSQLLTDIALEGRETCGHQLSASDTMLIAGGKSGFAGSPEHEQDHRFFRIARKAVRAEADGE